MLDDLGIGRSNEAETKLPIPEEVQCQTRIDPIPKNMDPEYNKGRRAARAKALINLRTNNTHAWFVDVAEYQRNIFAAVVIEALIGATRTAAALGSAGVEQSEEVAIALAITDADCHTVLSDLRQVGAKLHQRRNLQGGRVVIASSQTARQKSENQVVPGARGRRVGTQ